MRENPPDSARASREVTRVLNLMASGRAEERPQLVEQVVDELRAIASRSLAGERRGHTLQATALVNEVYLRLVGDPELAWDSRGHFYSAAAEAVRRILIEHARKRGRLRRGGAWRRIPLEGVDLAAFESREKSEGLLALDEVLGRLQGVDARAAEVVRLRFYAGLDVDSTALALGVSKRTVLRDWGWARAWLAKELGAAEPDPPTS